MPYLKCHICTLKYGKYVFFGDNLAVNSIIAKILKKLCKPKLDKNLGYDYVNHNQDSERGNAMIAINISLKVIIYLSMLQMFQLYKNKVDNKK